MDQFFKFRAFVLVAEKQSFSKAADALGVTTGAVSRTILKLEEEVHIRLIHRTTRSVALTDEAKSYYETCCRMLEEMDEANRRITQAREGECGKLNLVVHPALAGLMFARFVGSYRDLAPKVNLNVRVQNSVCNLNDGRFDVAILPSRLVEQPTVIRRDLLTSPAALVASPEYLDRCGAPARASALETRFLLLSQDGSRSESRAIEMLEDRKRVKVVATSRMNGDELHVRASALDGVGIAVLPQAMVRDDIQSGSLVHVLPSCMVLSNEIELCLFYAHRELLSARLRTFVNFCMEFFRAESATTTQGLAATFAGSRQHARGILAAA